MQHIYIIRHGQTEDNANKIVSGSRETTLSTLGITQAQTAAQHAQEFGFDLIVASSMTRAQQTATIIAHEIQYSPDKVLTMPDFVERDLGELEGTNYLHNEILNGNFPAVDHMLGVEKLTVFYNRVQHGLRQLLQDTTHKTILIICHAGVGRMLQTIVSGKSVGEFYNQPRLENATIYPLI